MPQILDSLPELYRDLFPEFFHREVPVEEKATCSSCAMCESSCGNAVAPVDGVSRFFRPDTKCCTYHPRLPNYLVGAILADTDPAMAEGRRRIGEKLASRVGVTPQWVNPPARYTLLYGNANRAFGRSTSLLCPYYERAQGNCTIWRYREAVCSTFFCKYVAGADGRKFWMTLKTYLSLAEIQLSRYAVLKLAPEYIHARRDKPEPAGTLLSADDLDERGLPEKEYRALWGAWAGREAQFFLEAHALVKGLKAEDLERLLGLDGVIEQTVLERLHQASVKPTLPRALKFNPDATVRWMPDGSVALGSYSENDAVALPGEAYPLLVEFTGRDSVPQTRERLRTQRQADLGEDVLLELYRHRILIEA
ncbi:hypothetical protein FGE12_07060 [Aggregicoccus sp. 17bor-14]|uniref:hypothetical protein n=1 Tax=Myxococcaceae TaxID=31 RepID=UPI00129C6775|nr:MULTISPECIES: hypothetical protein [Myxococcaceae]MBF5042149.1 hypothetical protein [Simulacricoccus sp. 17bor-14]MRI87926.1 hypothetical protein [Aggregicoccus sp. 17bor-14]